MTNIWCSRLLAIVTEWTQVLLGAVRLAVSLCCWRRTRMCVPFVCVCLCCSSCEMKRGLSQKSFSGLAGDRNHQGSKCFPHSEEQHVEAALSPLCLCYFLSLPVVITPPPSSLVSVCLVTKWLPLKNCNSPTACVRTVVLPPLLIHTFIFAIIFYFKLFFLFVVPKTKTRKCNNYCLVTVFSAMFLKRYKYFLTCYNKRL